jgi:hypothetical protein
MGQGAGTGRGLGRCGSNQGLGRRNNFDNDQIISGSKNIASLEKEEEILKEKLATIQKEKEALGQ